MGGASTVGLAPFGASPHRLEKGLNNVSSRDTRLHHPCADPRLLWPVGLLKQNERALARTGCNGAWSKVSGGILTRTGRNARVRS